MACSTYDPVSRDYIGDVYRGLRHRSGYPGTGRSTHGDTRHSHEFNRTFWQECSDWADHLNFYAKTFYPHGEGPRAVSWYGDVGVIGHCENSGFSWHQKARALDLTNVQFEDGSFCDMNWTWRQERTGRRKYLGIAASLRVYFGTVITQWFDDDHLDHIHFDNGVDYPPIRDKSSRVDATLVQAASNLLNGTSLAVDGDWGDKTQAAYEDLKRALNLGCTEPKTNTAHATLFFIQIEKHGLADRAAGYYTGYC